MIYCSGNYFSPMIEHFHRLHAMRKSTFISIIQPKMVILPQKFFQKSAPDTYINVNGYIGYNKLKDFKKWHCYAYIRSYFSGVFQKIKIISIRQYKVSSIAINGLNMSGVTGKRHSYKQIYAYRPSRRKSVVESFLV